MNQGKKKIKIELEDATGGKYNLSLEGNFSKNKLMRVMELMDVLNDGDTNNESTVSDNIPRNSESVGTKLWNLISNNFPNSSFTSTDLLDLYRSEYGEKIQLSIISTYLSRFSDKGRLARNKRGKEWIYKMVKASISRVPNDLPLDYSSSSSLSQEVPLTVYDLPL